jgi:osmotically-inducible protein OsmY
VGSASVKSALASPSSVTQGLERLADNGRNSYAGELAAERAVKRARGVRAVANNLQVTLRLARTDTDIATDAAHALETHLTLPPTVQVVVHNGHVVLTGTVHTLFQRVVAEKALRYVRGIKGLVNRLAATSRRAA